MSQPQGPPAPEPSTDVVEFGGSGPDETHARTSWWRRPAELQETRTGWALAVLGAAALFASLIGEWATTTVRYDGGGLTETHVVGVGTAGNWGAGWMIGALALVAAVGMCLAGPARQRAAARVAGLAVAGVLLLLMVAATIEISNNALIYDPLSAVPAALRSSAEIDVQTEVSMGRGLFAAYAALGLFAAVLWLSAVRPRAGSVGSSGSASAPAAGGSGQPPGTPPGTGADLTVQPAEPFIHPTGDHEWR